MKNRFISFFFLLAYCFVLIEVLVLKQLPVIRIDQMKFNFGGIQEGPSNFIPFKTIIPYLLGKNGALIAAINIIGNIVALVPLGFLVPFVYPKMNWRKTILVALLSGLCIEITQVVLHIGIFDIDDVLLNAMGVLIGFWKYNLLSKWPSKIKNSIIAILILVTGSLCIFLTLSYFKKIKFPVGIEANDKTLLAPLNNNAANSNQKGECCDLCNGSGGTGRIIKTDNNSIRIIRKDGVEQSIKLTKQTTIKTSEGVATNSALKIGLNVTVIIDDTETASLVLVCKSN